MRILKVDSRGRVRIPPEKQDEILEEFGRSGMSGSAFAAHIGVKYSTFASWRRRRGQARSRPKSATARPQGVVRFLEAQPASSGAALELDLCGSVRMRITDRSQIGLAVELLRGLTSC